MSDIILTDGQRLLRDEARAFVRDEVPRQLLLDMDAERVRSVVKKSRSIDRRCPT